MRISRALAGIGLVEVPTLVIYDIVEDRARLKVSEMCLDFGLQRIQYSAFAGRLNRNRREELCLRLQALLRKEEASGRVRVQPICDRDFREAWEVETESGLPEEPGRFAVRNRASPGRPREPQTEEAPAHPDQLETRRAEALPEPQAEEGHADTTGE